MTYKYPDCPISASLYSSVEARAKARPIQTKTVKEIESRITNVSGLETLFGGGVEEKSVIQT